MKLVILFSFLVMWPTVIIAENWYDFCVDGIFYKKWFYEQKVDVVSQNFYNYNYPSNYSGNVIIPSSVTYNGVTYTVARIGGGAFYKCTGLTSVTIPNSIKSIGGDAFYGCTGLTSITIPSSVGEIEHGAFLGCTGLTSITIPRSVGTIDFDAFSDCTGLKFVIVLNPMPVYLYRDIFPNDQLVFVPDVSLYENASVWKNYNLQLFAIVPQITKVKITSNELLPLKGAVLKDASGEIVKSVNAQYNDYLTLTDLMPDSTYKVSVTVAYEDDEYEINDTFTTNSFAFHYQYSNEPTQTTFTTVYKVDRDDGYVFDACGMYILKLGDGYHYDDECGCIIETTNDSVTIEYSLSDLTPNFSYSCTPWVKYKATKYSPFMTSNHFTTKPIDMNPEIEVTPTSVHLTGTYSAGDAVVNDSFFTFNGENYESLYETGLDPQTTYYYKYTIETTSGNQVNGYSFYTPALSMVAQPVKMLTNTTVMFEAQTNMIDEETMVGFEWRRYDAPDEMPSTQVYSPVFGGKIAGSLKNLAENVYYKYRPFYKSNTNKMYYGDWVAFLTADAGVEYEPMVYTYNSPVVSQTEATLQGVALRGSDEITEQGFEYWKNGNNTITKVIATGERMSKKVVSLQPGTKYTFRAFLTAGGKTYFGAEVDFATLSNSLDVNLDGEINIADVNAVIDIILTGSAGLSGDVNGDGEVNIADINTIIDAILSN